MFGTSRCPALSIRLSLVCKLLRERNTVVNTSKSCFFGGGGRCVTITWPATLPLREEKNEIQDWRHACLARIYWLVTGMIRTRWGPNGDQTVAPKPEEPCVTPPPHPHPPPLLNFICEKVDRVDTVHQLHMSFLDAYKVVVFFLPSFLFFFFYYADTNSPTICNFTLDRLFSLAFSFLPFALFGLFRLQEIVHSGEFKRANTLYLFDFFFFSSPPVLHILCWDDQFSPSLLEVHMCVTSLVRHLSRPRCT